MEGGSLAAAMGQTLHQDNMHIDHSKTVFDLP
jgi:hypothetical protein